MFKSIAFIALAAASAFAAATLELSARAGGLTVYNVLPVIPNVYNIHPVVDGSKCVGIVGGVYNNGSQVDIYDCNNTPTQHWQWNGNSLVSVNPTDGNHWCLDAGNVNEIKNGVQMKIWQCFNNLPQQTWSPVVTTSGQLALSVKNVCLDLTNGNTANGNVLQIWECVAGNRNQIWNFSLA